MSELKPCPCGKTPTELSICDAGQGGKWAYVMGDCCSEWIIEFRTEYNLLTSKEAMELAIQAWNETPRDQQNEALMAQVEELTAKLIELTACLEPNYSCSPEGRAYLAGIRELIQPPQQSLDSLKSKVEEETIERCAIFAENCDKATHPTDLGDGLRYMPRKYKE